MIFSTNLDAAAGTKISDLIFHIWLFISSKVSMFFTFKELELRFSNMLFTSSLEKPSSLITPPNLSIIPTILTPAFDK